MSISAIYPATRPSLVLDFANTKQLDSRITFTRNSTATYYDGKSVVKAEENLLTYSQDFTNAAWNNSNLVTVTANATTAPDGTNTASKITPTSGSTNSYIGCNISASLTNGLVLIDIETGAYKVTYNTIGSVSSVYVGNGWRRIFVTQDGYTLSFYAKSGEYKFIAVQMYNLIRLRVSNTFVTHDLTSAANGTDSLYIWGVQLEQRAYATAYTPTTTSAITNYIPPLQTAASGTARFDHDPVTGESKGLLIEEQRTNLITYSDYSALNSTAYLSILNNVGIAPDGTNTASLVTGQSGTAVKYFYRGYSTTNTGTYTTSVFVKYKDEQYVVLRINDQTGVNEGRQRFDILNGVKDGSAVNSGTATGVASSITPVGNGWYRLTVTVTFNSALTLVQAASLFLNGYGSTPNTTSFYVWGAQLEAGAFATTYIPTPLTYTGRASTATYKAADGLIRITGNDVARYEPNASGGSNLLLESAVSSYGVSTTINTVGGYWADVVTSGGSSVQAARLQANAITAPDGSVTGALVTQTQTSGYQRIVVGMTGVANTTMTASVYAKKGTANTFCVEISGGWLGTGEYGTGRYFYTFGDVVVKAADNATTATNCSVKDIGGGWYRVSIAFSSPNAAGAMWLFPGMDISGTGSAYTYFWGTQLEIGSTSTSYIPSVETHTGRASTATYYDSTGTIRVAASGQPRWTYNPSLLTAPPKLLLEAASTNLILQSEAQDTASWSKQNCTITANTTTAPDGTSNADKIAEDSTTNYHYTGQSITTTSGTVYCFSAYAKAAERKMLYLEYNTNSGFPAARFDLLTGTVHSTVGSPLASGIQYIGNGWYRCWVSVAATGASLGVYIQPNLDDGGRNYTGTAGSGLYIWGVQIEVGYTPTSYIPTSGATVTRAADTSTSVAGSRAADVYSSSQVTRAAETASITGTNFSSWYRTDEGSFAIDAIYQGIPITGVVNRVTMNLRNSSGSADHLRIMWWEYGLYSACHLYVGGAYYATVFSGSISAGRHQQSIAYKANDMALSTDGSAPSGNAVDTALRLFTPDIMDIGHGANSNFLNGTIKRLAYYPKRLSNTEIQALTS